MSNYTYDENNFEESLPMNTTILVEKNVIWNDGNDPVEEAEFSNSDNTTLTDNVNETFMTADGDNTTQYFSVLESSTDTILNDISNVVISNSDICEDNNTLEQQQLEESNSCIDIGTQQVMLFKIDGSDELYGIQVGHDEVGNLQKYQFKVRQNEEGNLEAVPDSIQILPLDTEINYVNNETNRDNEETLTNYETNDQQPVLIKQEQNVGNSLQEDSCHEDYEENEYEETHDTKEGILDVTATTTHKQEIFDQESASDEEEYPNTHSPSYFRQPTEERNNLEEEHSNFYISEDHHHHSGEEEPEVAGDGHYEELFVKESHLIVDDDIQHDEPSEEISIEPSFPPEIDSHESQESSEYDTHYNDVNENESDNEDYEVVDGVHVTGDAEDFHEENQLSKEDEFAIRKSLSFERQISKYKTHRIIKNVIRKVKVRGSGNENKSSTYYLIRDPEKENFEITSNTFVPKPNPRSILKCSLPTPTDQKKYPEEEKYEKRFAKSKEAQQARLFHNFIAQTKIIHAPVRQERLPRKQKIKPMERTDEEIVVQEVVVSSNGFIETSEDGVLKERTPLKPTEYIQLSDSDEDYDPKGKQKRKRKHKKRRSQDITTISDSEDDSIDSVIEIDASGESESEVTSSAPKRPRGRPPKNPASSDTGDCTENGHTTTKRPRGRPPKMSKNLDRSTSDEKDDSIETIIIKTDYKCPKCPKSFPSEGGLSTHMQFHNFNYEPNLTLKNKNHFNRKSTVFTNKYMCDICGESFKNNFLLMRHISSHKSNNLPCTICKKIFSDNAQLVAHKRTHIKEQMFKTTTLPKDSPKKTQVQRIKKSQKELEHKCNDCGKVFSKDFMLSVHAKLHKKFICSFCKKSFLSKFMLDAHVRQNCVKSSNRRLSTNIRKSFMNPPVAPVPIKRTEIQSVKPNETVTNIKCDSCSMTFATYTSLFKHKVIKHGLETPDKSVTNESSKKSLCKKRSEHGGIPASATLKNVFVGLKSKLEKF